MSTRYTSSKRPVLLDFRGTSCGEPFRVLAHFETSVSRPDVDKSRLVCALGLGWVIHRRVDIPGEEPNGTLWFKGESQDAEGCVFEDNVEVLDDFGRDAEQARRLFREVRAAEIAELRRRQGR